MVLWEYVTRFRNKFLRMAEYHTEVAYRKMNDSTEAVEILTIRFQDSPAPYAPLRKQTYFKKPDSRDEILTKHNSTGNLSSTSSSSSSKSSYTSSNASSNNSTGMHMFSCFIIL